MLLPRQQLELSPKLQPVSLTDFAAVIWLPIMQLMVLQMAQLFAVSFKTYTIGRAQRAIARQWNSLITQLLTWMVLDTALLLEILILSCHVKIWRKMDVAFSFSNGVCNFKMDFFKAILIKTWNYPFAHGTFHKWNALLMK